MSDPIIARPIPIRRALFAGGLIIATPLIITLVIMLVVGGRGIMPSAVSVVGPPVRVENRAFVLTSQWKTFRPISRSLVSSGTYTDLLIDVWAFDAANAKPVWRHRLATQRRGVNMGRELLGAQENILWVIEPDGLSGLSLKDGSLAADAAAIEAANPALKGLMPTEPRYYHFDAAGLAFRAADGRDWRLVGPGLKVAPQEEAPKGDAAKAPLPGVTMRADIAGGNGTWVFQSRGLHIGKVSPAWLGLMAAPEEKTFRERGGIGGVDPRYPRTKLWMAKVGSKPTFFGPKPVYSDFRALPEGPEYLEAGLLSRGGRTYEIPILLFKPDSVLVLHRDRLGAGNHLKLTRASGPLGKPLWTADLPIDKLEAVMAGDGSVVLEGRREEPGPGRKTVDAYAVSVDHIIAVDLATGRMGDYRLMIKATKPEDIPAAWTGTP